MSKASEYSERIMAAYDASRDVEATRPAGFKGWAYVNVHGSLQLSSLVIPPADIPAFIEWLRDTFLDVDAPPALPADPQTQEGAA